jgi:hypothetical protein
MILGERWIGIRSKAIQELLMKLRILLFILFAAILTNCSKDESTKSNSTPPSLPQPITLTAPNSVNAPAEVKNGSSTINSYSNTVAIYIQLLGQTNPAFDGKKFIWSYSFSGATVEVTAQRTGKDVVEWAVSINGAATSGTTYNDWTAVSGTTSEDGKSQTWHLYQTNSATEIVQVAWQTDANAVLTAMLQYPAPISEKLQVINRPDSSGSYTKRLSNIVTYDALWKADGSGSYQEWDANGNLIAEGTWE